MLAHGELEDAVRDGEVAHDGPRGQPGREEVVTQRGELGRLDRRDRAPAPPRREVEPDAVGVVLDRLDLAALDVLDVAQEAGGGVGERGRVGLDVVGALTDRAALANEHVGQGVLGG